MTIMILYESSAGRQPALLAKVSTTTKPEPRAAVMSPCGGAGSMNIEQVIVI
jgi:hypothetical protein